MTSFAFIMGVLPQVFADGAGAEIRAVMGLTVFAGMLGVTFFGLFLTPVFYVVIRLLATRGTRSRQARAPRATGRDGVLAVYAAGRLARWQRRGGSKCPDRAHRIDLTAFATGGVSVRAMETREAT
jgi:hypothetical protein